MRRRTLLAGALLGTAAAPALASGTARAAASAASGHTDWKLLYDGAGLNAFGEVVIDETRVAQDGVLSVMYQERSSGTTPSPLHVVDFRLPA